LLKSSNPNGIAYVETQSLDGEMNLKHKSAIRDMQDAILSPADASTINGHIFCDQPNDYLYNFDGMMSIKVKNSDDSYKYTLGYNQLLQRGSSLKTAHWIYGIVVYTGYETKIQQHEAAKKRLQAPMKTSKMDKLMNKFVGYILAIEVAAAAFAAYKAVRFEQNATHGIKYLEGKKTQEDLIDVQITNLPSVPLTVSLNFP
jgi:phospholipid-transporting ATPase